MQTILVTGSNGLLGQKLVEQLLQTPNIRLIATSKNHNRLVDSENTTFELLDITNKTELDYIIKRYKPDTIINAAAITNVDFCEDNKTESWQVNVEALNYLSQISNELNIHLIHISSDFIFDGLTGNYSEDDAPNPVSYYGLTKLEGEKIVQSNVNKWTIIRTVLVYGLTKNRSRSNIVLWVKKSLENNTPINVVDDQFRTPTLVEDLAQACVYAAIKEKEGIYHVSGKDFMSIYEIAIATADFFGLDKSLISKISSIDLNQKAKRPPRTGFNINKAITELDYQPHSFIEGLQIIKDQFAKNN
ncbi:MAG: NAD(P)-dependent oxidoreductase [Bacteroidetes bacterium]|nr:MAG: NAD(P)-dependent oxidoreductase [Bacteroidota bacterium]